MTVLLVLILFYIESSNAIPCDWSCPSDKPLCSEVGCIFECPEPFYINGSNCVSDCGELLVDENRNCVASCPVNMVYKITLKQVRNSQYLERKCGRCNQPDQLVSAGSCVKVCPANTRFIDENNCVSKCPVERSLKINITLHELLHFKCVEKCPRMEDNNFCRDKCPENKLIFQSSCVERCPSSYPFLQSNRCETKCPENSPSAGYNNMTCVNQKCPEKRTFVFNNTCVEMCPITAPLIASTDRFNYCVNNCEGKYKYNNHCLQKCPTFTVAVYNTCLRQCPSNASFSCVITPGDKCGQRPAKPFHHSVCMDSCPQTMLLLNQTCVFSCPSGLSVYGRECTDICPIDYPYKGNVTETEDCSQDYWGSTMCRTVTAVLTCVKKCPANSYIVNNSCLPYCPYHLPQKDNKCVSKCPTSAPFIKNATVVAESWMYRSYYYRPYIKVEQKKTVQKCVSVCDDGMLILNQTCVETCPEDQPYIYNRTCLQKACETKYTTKVTSGIICTDKCKLDHFVLNKTCVETCPITQMIFNGTCVDVCPESHLLSGMLILGETCDASCTAKNVLQQCVEKCPNGLFVYNNSCVSFCNTPLHTADNRCVETCPFEKPYTNTFSITVVNWIRNGKWFTKRNTVEVIMKCEAMCPSDKVSFGYRCIDHCPLHSRFVLNGTCKSEPCTTNYKFYTSVGIICHDECPHGLFIQNDTCYSRCPDSLYTIGQKCISDCPPTHNYINNDTFVKHEYNCSDLNDKVCTQNLTYVLRCQENCPENRFIYKNSCVEFCSNNSVVFNRTCVTSCPESHPFSQPLIQTMSMWIERSSGSEWYLKSEDHHVHECVVKCADKYQYYFENTCKSSCPSTAPNLDDKNECVEKCPGDRLLDINTTTCANECAKDRALFNKSCYVNCPEEYKYIFDSQCVSECPFSYAASEEDDRFICQDKNLWAKITSGVLLLVFLLVSVCSRRSLMDFLYILRLMFTSEANSKEIQKQMQLCRRTRKRKEGKIPFEGEVSFHTENEEIVMELQGDNTENILNHEYTRL